MSGHFLKNDRTPVRANLLNMPGQKKKVSGRSVRPKCPDKILPYRWLHTCGVVFCPFCELPSYFLLSSHLCHSPPYMILNCLKEAGLLDGFSPISVGSNASTTENPSKSKKRKVSGKPSMRILSPRQTTPRQKLSLSSQPSNKSKIVIRIHQCGKLGVQLEPFTHAQQGVCQKSETLDLGTFFWAVFK